MHKLKTIFLYATVLSLFASPVFAQEICTQDDSTTSTFFINTRSISRQISLSYCRNESSDKLQILLDSWEEAIHLESKKLRDLGIDLKPHMKSLLQQVTPNDQHTWPRFSVTPEPVVRGYRFRVDNSRLKHGSFDDSINEKCKSIPEYQLDCFSVMEELRDAINVYTKSMVIKKSDIALKRLKLYSSEWEAYFTQARSQTMWELFANGLIFKKEITSKTFVQPPAWQLTLFHPNVVIEHVNAAPQGNRLKEALSVEWLGINWWNLKMPFGFSAMATYSDRAGVRNVGHGMVFHFYNAYSIGVSGYDRDIGISVSLDLLKAFESKKSQIEKYKQMIDKK